MLSWRENIFTFMMCCRFMGIALGQQYKMLPCMLVSFASTLSSAAGHMTDRSQLAEIVQRACSHRDDHCVKCHWPRTSTAVDLQRILRRARLAG